MSSAELFLRLLEEKDLVSAQVLQAARREFPGGSPPPSAMQVSLWLVQGHHITANQAERLLAAAAERAEQSPAKPPAASPPPPAKPPVSPPRKPAEPQAPAGRVVRPVGTVPSPKPPLPQVPASPAGKPDTQKAKTVAPASQAGKPDLRPAADDDLGLAPLDEDEKAPKPSTSRPAPPQPQKPATAATAKTANGDKKTSAAGTIGDDLKPLDSTMKGPLDSLIDSEVMDAAGLEGPGGPELGAPVSRKFKLRRFLRNLFRRKSSDVVRVKAADPKQVKVLLISWGVAIFLIIGLLSVFHYFGTPTDYLKKAEDAVAAAEAATVDKDYTRAAADYTQAADAYDNFLSRSPEAKNANEVRVRKGLAKLRIAEAQATASGDWTPAFAAIEKEIKELPKDRPDSEPLEKVTNVAAKIGEALAEQMQGHPDAESVGRVQTVVYIVQSLQSPIPDNKRQWKNLLDETLQILQHGRDEVESSHDLDQTLVAITAAARADDIGAAYSAYRELIKQYPGLVDNARIAARIADAMKPVSALQQKLVTSAAQSLAAVGDEKPSGLMAAMPLAVQPLAGQLEQGKGKHVFAVEQGTAYGLDAASGKVLWRRFVSLDPHFPAVAALPAPGLQGRAGGDVVLCDWAHQELLRVEGETGALMWRLAVGQPIVAEPVRAGNWLLLLTKDGRLTPVDLATGGATRCFHLPQAVNLPPIVDSAHGLIYLVADATNLIVVGGELPNGQCRQVLHVGHEAGTIVAPPAIVGDFLLLPVVESPGESTIRVISISKGNEGEPLQPVQAIRMAGSIETTPAALELGAAVVTAQGGLYALQRDKSNDKRPFQIIASRPATSKETSAHYLFSDMGGPADADKFWVIDREMNRYAVRADTPGDSDLRILPESTVGVGQNFIQAPSIEEGTMFSVVIRAGMPGAIVAAFNLAKNDAIWQTWLAAPLVADPMIGPASGKLALVTASGGVFRRPLADWKPQGRPWDPVLTIDSSRLSKPLRSLLPMPGERFAMSSGKDTTQIVIYDPKEQDKQFRFLKSPKEMSAAPGYFAGGLLTPCVNGQVCLLDLEALGDIANPLKPAPKPVPTWEWRTPVAVDDKLAVLCDPDGRLVTVGINADDEKVLAESGSTTWKNRFVSSLALLGKSIFVVDSANNLVDFEVPGLAGGNSLPLGSALAWGPERVGNMVFAATEKGQLFAVDEHGQLLWQKPIGDSPLAGAPCLAGDELYLAARNGTVWRASAADGTELGKIDVGCPLGSGPLVVGTRVIVGGQDGSMLEVKKP